MEKAAFIQSLMPVAVQLTAQFIRALRNGIIVGMRWLAAVDVFRTAMKAYLSRAPDTVALPRHRQSKARPRGHIFREAVAVIAASW